VKHEPPDLDRAALAGALRRHWGIDPERVEYAPVGYGSHHWAAVGADGSHWFVSADELGGGDATFARLDRAFRTAAALRDRGGLEFVLAPVVSRDGAALHRLGVRYAIRVEPFVEGPSGVDGEFESADERRAMGTLLGRLHTASDSVPAALPGREGLALSGRAALELAIAELDGEWGPGPFTERARELLRAHASEVGERLHAYDGRTRRALDAPGRWVVTHGEPHSSNVIQGPGGPWLVDWDTTLVGPPERDLWMILDADLTGWDEYREAAGADRLDEELLALYRERWALAEICEYVAELREPHEDTEDTRASWRILREYLP
jgi:aminoglycoside phosphotransferase (APT) family kinase protein